MPLLRFQRIRLRFTARSAVARIFFEGFNHGVLDSVAGNHIHLRVNHPDARRLASDLAVGDITPKRQNLHKYQALYRSES